jgi:hypothetical protein
VSAWIFLRSGARPKGDAREHLRPEAGAGHRSYLCGVRCIAPEDVLPLLVGALNAGIDTLGRGLGRSRAAGLVGFGFRRILRAHDIANDDDCDRAGEHSNSPSFSKGCRAYVDGDTLKSEESEEMPDDRGNADE